MDSASFAAYFAEAEKRANLWFCGERIAGRSCADMPELPSAAGLYGALRFVEERARGQTCFFDPESRTITVPSDKWRSGCVPHELLHAALNAVGHPCWRAIEHRPYAGWC